MKLLIQCFKQVKSVAVVLAVLASVQVLALTSIVQAQDTLPRDNGLATYHTSPRYRESESHPLRVLAYVVYPVGWLAREVIFRPFSYLVSSTEETRSIFGYREPFDYRQPECFSGDDSVPDCRSVAPFNYDAPTAAGEVSALPANSEAPFVPSSEERQVYFPDVNFDFNSRSLNDLGKGRVRQIAQLLNSAPGLTVVLQGNTDNVGSNPYNEKLGMDRADAVKGELVALGISADRLQTVSFGQSQPVFSEQEGWARAVNRRVDIKAGAAPAAPEAAAAPVAAADASARSSYSGRAGGSSEWQAIQ